MEQKRKNTKQSYHQIDYSDIGNIFAPVGQQASIYPTPVMCLFHVLGSDQACVFNVCGQEWSCKALRNKQSFGAFHLLLVLALLPPLF